jgi:predicted DNA binding CopG/RHH family protein
MTTQGNLVGSVLDNFLSGDKPVAAKKDKSILQNLRISESLLFAFKKYCFLNNKKMTNMLIDFIFEQLENFEKLETIENKYSNKTTLLNFRITEKLRDDFHRVCKEHGTDATKQLTQYILRTVENA